ncbi:MAG: ATP-dependent DNA helicase RecG [Pseudoflavonifractor sp.]|nr:ATP-dependent DNA helicase RecG [Alloprevotella sp.]MCM1116832.1 ATP-dependent DNA helicase RecG [Pseudoflavonifractor sp.]
MSTDLTYIKGVGPRRAKLLASELGLHTVDDLVEYFPSSYVDRSSFMRIEDFVGDQMASVQVKGRFVTFTTQGEGAKRRLVGLFTDGRSTMEVIWFRRIEQLKKLYLTGTEYVIFGRPSLFKATGRWSMVHPEVDMPGSKSTGTGGLRGVYPLTERLRNGGIDSRQLFTIIQNALGPALQSKAETLPPEIITRYRLMGIRESLTQVHNPSDTRQLEAARYRLKFEELFYLQLNIQLYGRRRKASIEGYRFPRIGHFFNRFYSEMLPFPLTEAQKRVIREIHADTVTGRQMNRLVQGDVGSGKTLVALFAMLIALDNGKQACLMAPTEILAGQHYETIRALAAPLGVNVKLLTGSTRKKERELIDSQLLDGSLHILIGTHALIEDGVRFRELGLAVIDEQHRFGVAQRARLWKKNTVPPHVLVMTATPIPRTLAMTVYGDLDVSVIDELPPGRKPVTTLLRYEEQRLDVYRSVGSQLREGRQVYIVYPAIKENEKSELHSVEEGYEEIREIFRDYKVAMVHGALKPAEKDYQMSLFASGKAHILVATTVIEVGVNVPNASVMIIENAERFGLSQLHQLRGRVGRGAAKSYCVLMSKYQLSKDTRRRLEVMTSTTDGFVVAEADLKMRGPGDLEGTAQSGLPIDLKIASLSQDGDIVAAARSAASDTLDADPDLSSALLRSEMHRRFDRAIDWSRIS